MKRIGTILFACAAVLLSATAAWAQAEPAGTILRLRGDVTIVGVEGAARLAGPNAVLFVGDRILTGRATRLEFELLDGAVLALGDDSDLTVDRMAFDPRIGTGALGMTLNHGVFRFVSGGLGLLRAGTPAALRTPVGTIKLSRTDIWGEQAGERLQARLLDGGFALDTPFGRIEALDPYSGVQVDGPLAAPFVLPPGDAATLRADVARAAF
ncbi:MAG: hypothetical protein AB7G39_07695 [Alphaproteobacteria bacterium]